VRAVLVSEVFSRVPSFTVVSHLKVLKKCMLWCYNA